jgi:uncharacterized NAD-dependent epimerase/dehydratase family protein
MPIPKLEVAFEPYLNLARLTNPKARFAGVSVNTSNISEKEADRLLSEIEDRFGLPAIDPIRHGPGKIVDELLKI